MKSRETGLVEITYDQEVFMVIWGEGEQAKMLIEDDHLVVFESLWHVGPLVHDLQALGISARVVSKLLYALYCLAQSMDLDLWILRHDGTVTSVEEIVFL